MMSKEVPVDPNSPAGRLRKLRKDAEFPSMDAFAKEHGFPPSSYRANENGKRGITKRKAAEYAKLLNSSEAYILLGIEGDTAPYSVPSGQVRIPLDTPANVDNHEAESRDLTQSERQGKRALLPIFSSEPGPGGGFVMNAAPAKHTQMPERLSGLKDPHALYMIGDDMFPRLKHGELIFPHPHDLAMPESVVIIVFKRSPQEWIARDLVKDDGGARVVVRRYGKGNTSGTEEIICRSEILRIVATVSATYLG